MSENIKRIDEDMTTKIKEVVNEHLFKYAEKDDLINMMDTMFETLYSKIESLAGQPKMFKTLIDLNDDITKHDIEEAFDLFQHRCDDCRADDQAQLEPVRDGCDDGVRVGDGDCDRDGECDRDGCGDDVHRDDHLQGQDDDRDGGDQVSDCREERRRDQEGDHEGDDREHDDREAIVEVLTTGTGQVGSTSPQSRMVEIAETKIENDTVKQYEQESSTRRTR